MLESDPIPSPQQLQALIDETIDEVFEEEEDIVTEMGPKVTPTPETVVERFENKFRIWQRDVKIKDANEVLELDCDELVEMYNNMKDNLNLLSDLTGAEFDQLYPDYNARLATIKRKLKD